MPNIELEYTPGEAVYVDIGDEERAPDVWRVEKIEILKNLVVNYHLLNTKTGQTVEGPGTFYGYDEIRQMRREAGYGPPN